VLVFVASSVIHMALPWHRNDYPAVPDEDRTLEALLPLGLKPGEFALWPFWIWYRRALGTTVRSTIDGLVCALLAAGTLAVAALNGDGAPLDAPSL
jgi:hypothetical protein